MNMVSTTAKQAHMIMILRLRFTCSESVKNGSKANDRRKPIAKPEI